MPKWLGASALVVLVCVACASGHEPAAHPGGEETLWRTVPPGWRRLAPPPFTRARAVSVWTGKDLFYWGGDTRYGGEVHADGALFDPATGDWHRIPDGPLGGRSSAGAVWTGKHVFIWGGSGGYQRAWSNGALFDPATGEWQRLPPSPLSPRTPVAVVWTGREVLVWGDRDRSGGPEPDGAAYDPRASKWRPLPAAPFGLNEAEAVWTGSELIVFGAQLDGNNHSDTRHARGIAYDPKTDAWRILADYPLSPQASSVSWTGNELLAWDYELAAGVYDPLRNSWRTAARLPLRFSECYPDSARLPGAVLAWFCGAGATFDIAVGEWRVIPAAPEPIFGHPVSANSVVLFAGAAHEGGGNALWVYRPPGATPQG